MTDLRPWFRRALGLNPATRVGYGLASPADRTWRKPFAPVPSVRERVAAGAAVLDHDTPGWAQNIDLDQLDMTHGSKCVIGQTFGTYFAVIGRLSGQRGYDDQDDWAMRHGFTADPDRTDPDNYYRHNQEWEELNRAWSEHVRLAQLDHIIEDLTGER